jgi:hypothetical protein
MEATMTFIAKIMRFFKKRDSKDRIDGVRGITDHITQRESIDKSVCQCWSWSKFRNMAVNVIGDVGRR